MVNINPAPISYMWIIGAAGFIAVLGGAALTNEIGSPAAAIDYAVVGAALMGLALSALFYLRRRSRHSATAALCFLALFIQIPTTPLILALGLPLLLRHGLGSDVGMTMSGYFVVITAYQLWMTQQWFERRWREAEASALRRFYDAEKHAVHIAAIARRLRLSIRLYLPPGLENIVWGAMVLSMFVGLAFKQTGSLGSVMMICVPALTFVAAMIQCSMYPLLLGWKLKLLESKDGGPITIHEFVRRR